MTADEMREMQWVRPELVAQIRFVGVDGRGSAEARRISRSALRQERAGGAARTPCLTVSVRPRGDICYPDPDFPEAVARGPARG